LIKPKATTKIAPKKAEVALIVSVNFSGVLRGKILYINNTFFG